MAIQFVLVLTLGVTFFQFDTPTNTVVQDQPSGLQKEIDKLFKTQVAAWNRGDLEAFMSTYWKSENLTFSGGGKTTRGWQATLDNYKKGYPNKKAMGFLTFSDFEVTPLGSKHALALGKWHLKRESGDREGNFSVVLRKVKSQWLIIHDHSSSLEEED